MKKFLVIAAVLPLVAAGCPDDKPTPTPTPTPDTTTTNDTTTGDTTTGDTGPGPTVTNACLNDDDFNICNTCSGTDECTEDCPDPQGFAQAVATRCGLASIGKEDERQFALDCILPDTGLTNDCAGCYADIVLCSVEFCIAVCLDPSSEACATCQAENCVGDCEDGTDENNFEGADCADRSCAYDEACVQQ